jgi:hypothetical protein
MVLSFAQLRRWSSELRPDKLDEQVSRCERTAAQVLCDEWTTETTANVFFMAKTAMERVYPNLV